MQASQTAASAVGAAYTDVLYTGTPKPLAHPQRLAVLGSLAGVEVADPTRCRVLEIGCGNGAHLVWVASTLPATQCVGVDLAEPGIEAARRLAHAARAANTRFETRDVTVFDDGAPFDYVIMHGVYAWVPEQIRADLLCACRRLLSPQGLAFVSYNANPGCRARQLVRDMMMFHAGGATSVADRLRLAREAVPLIHAAVPDQASTYSQVLAHEIERLAEYPDFLLFHDDLSPHYQPVLFADFVAHARNAGLDYVADSQRMQRANELPAELIERLGSRAADRIVLEQYADFVFGRSFRQSIVCRADAPRVQAAARMDLDGLRASAELTVIEPAGAAASTDQLAFEAPGGNRITLDQPALKRTLITVAEAFPASVPIRALLGSVAAADRPLVSDLLVRLFDTGLLSFQRGEDIIASRAEDAAAVYPFALATLAMGYVCTPRGRYFELASERDADLFREVDRALRARSGQTAHRVDAEPLAIDAAIERLCRSGLLIGGPHRS